MTAHQANFNKFLATLLLGWLIGAPAAARAQVFSDVTDSTSVPQLGSGHDYVHLLNETVNPATGSVSIHINIPLPKQRGFNLPFSIGYDSNGLTAPKQSTTDLYTTVEFAPTLPQPCFYESGWRYSFPCLSARRTGMNFGGSPTDSSMEECSWIDSYVFYDPSGGSHALNLLLSQLEKDTLDICPATTSTTVTGGDDYYTATSTNDVAWQEGGTSALIADADGTVYNFPLFNDFTSTSGGSGSAATATTIYQTFAPLIEDRNGNKITYSKGTYTDSLGRTLLSLSSSTDNQTDTFTVAGFSKPYIVTWGGGGGGGYKLSNTLMPTNDTNCVLGYSHSLGGAEGGISSIELPNEDLYQFTYDPTYGTLKTITYPNGLSVSYDWGIASNLMQHYFSESKLIGSYGMEHVYTDYCPYSYDAVAVMGRHVYEGGKEVLTQAFSYTPATSFGGNTTTAITTTDKITGTITTTTITYAKGIAYANEFVPHSQWGRFRKRTK